MSDRKIPMQEATDLLKLLEQIVEDEYNKRVQGEPTTEATAPKDNRMQDPYIPSEAAQNRFNELLAALTIEHDARTAQLQGMIDFSKKMDEVYGTNDPAPEKDLDDEIA